jgi:hypothetical protein
MTVRFTPLRTGLNDEKQPGLDLRVDEAVNGSDPFTVQWEVLLSASATKTSSGLGAAATCVTRPHTVAITSIAPTGKNSRSLISLPLVASNNGYLAS